jgi:molybdate transport system substrate-binding protein
MIPAMVRRRLELLALVLIPGLVGSSCIGCEQTFDPDEIPRQDGREVVIFAAASLRDVMEELRPLIQAATGFEPVYNFAGSNVLARQIEASRQADVLVSANEDEVDRLEAAGRLVPGTRRALLSNRLVAVARRDSGVEVSAPRDLAAAEYRHLSIGDPRGVPAGIYARRFLEAVEVGDGRSLWQAVEERLAPAPDVRAALAQVEARRDVVGIVYATDARTSGEVRVLFEVPAELAPEVTYGAAAVAGGPAGEAAARAVLEVLGGGAAREVFARHGFAPPSRGGGAGAG